MNWNELTSEAQLETIDKESESQPVLIFKHSTRCSISATALNRIERNWNDSEMLQVKAYYLDLIAYRNVSNLVASHYGIMHESPQLLIIRNGKCVYHESHSGILYEDVKSFATA